MEIKEAIEWLEANKYLTKYKEVIKLLQRGEKYGAMWEEMLHQVNQIHPLHLNGEDIRRIINDIIQKYFPKEVDNETEIS